MELNHKKMSELYQQGYDKGAFDALADYKDSLKPEIPEIIAEHIEDMKNNDFSLLYALKKCPDIISDGFEYIFDQEKFARAWLYGYKVKKKPLYRVIFPNPKSIGKRKMMLRKVEYSGEVVMACSKVADSHLQLLTEEEIRKDFDWAWKLGFCEEVKNER